MWNPPTKKQLELIPNLYSQDGIKDKKIYMKLFSPSMTWYVVEINHKGTSTGYPPYTLMFTYKVDERTGKGNWEYQSLLELKNMKIGFVQVDREIHGITPRSPKRFSEIRELNN